MIQPLFAGPSVERLVAEHIFPVYSLQLVAGRHRERAKVLAASAGPLASDSDVGARERAVRSTPVSGHRQAGHSKSVRRLQAGLQSFLSMRRIDARRKNAKAFRLRHSQSLAKRRQRLSHAMVRSTIQRFGQDHKSAGRIGTFDNFDVKIRQNFCKRFRKFRP
jgi:hypothetical protein